jgi:hypothetical protein
MRAARGLLAAPPARLAESRTPGTSHRERVERGRLHTVREIGCYDGSHPNRHDTVPNGP